MSIILQYILLRHIITKEETQNAPHNVHDHPVIYLMQRIAHIHLVQAEIRYQPECIVHKVSSSRFSLFLVSG